MLPTPFENIILSFKEKVETITCKVDLAWSIIDHAIVKLDYIDCVVYYYDEKRETLIQTAASGEKKRKNKEVKNPIRIEPGEGIVGMVFSYGSPKIVSDTSRNSNYIIDDRFRLSEIAVPIITSSGKVIGVIDSENPKENFYTKSDLEILTRIAEIVAKKWESL